jgi:biotin carboxylase
MSNTIVNLGLGPWQTPLVDAARALGYRVIGVDRNPLAPGVEHTDEYLQLSVHEAQPIINALETHRPHLSAVITIGSRDSLTTAATVAAHYQVPGAVTHHDALNILVDRSAFRDFLVVHGLPTPPYEVVESPTGHVDLDLPLIVKTVRNTSGSEGLTVVENWSGLSGAIAHALEVAPDPVMGNKAIVERYIRGRDIGVLGIFGRGSLTFLAAVEREVDALPHCLPRHYQAPANLAPDIETMVRDQFIAIARHLDIKDGPFYVEFRLADDGSGLFALEGEPTLPAYAARLIGEAWDVDLYRQFVRCVVAGSNEQFEGNPVRHAACHFVYPDTPGTVADIVAPSEVKQVTTRVLAQPGRYLDCKSAASICAVSFAQANSAETVRALAADTAAKVHVSMLA